MNSIKAQLYDRIVSPLSGALIISWCLWNHKVLLVVFSSEIIQYKLNFIDTFYSLPFTSYFWTPDSPVSNALVNGLFGPIFTTFIYIFIYPAFAVPVYMFSLWIQKIYERAKNYHQQGRLLTFEQSIDLHKRIAELELDQEKTHKKYLENIEALQMDSHEKEVELRDIQDKYNSLLSEEKKSKKNDQDGSGQSLDDSLTTAGQYSDEDVESMINEGVERLTDGAVFQVSDLFHKNIWRSLTAKRRNAIGKDFKERVLRGDYLNVFLDIKGASGQQLYKVGHAKNSNGNLDEIKSFILSEFSKYPNGDYLAPSDMPNSDFHKMEVQYAFDQLFQGGFLKNQLGKYMLTAAGRAHIIKNNLHLN